MVGLGSDLAFVISNGNAAVKRGRGKVSWRSVAMGLTHVAVLSLVLLLQTRIVFPMVVYSLAADYPRLIPNQIVRLADDLFPRSTLSWLLEPLMFSTRCR